ncbi:MAG: hypothetical protein GX051_04005 [Clostridiales bacterium]|nr:hypothetical protein [Clostridiales bacterium]
MKDSRTLTPHKARFVKMFYSSDKEIPSQLFKAEATVPELDGFGFPLPSEKSEYTCFAEGANGVMWYGASTGLTRYDPHAENKYDIIMYFSADRDLPDNRVKALLPDGDNIWVLTEDGVAYIELRTISAEEKADILLDETLKYVSRHSMISQKQLAVPRDVSSAVKHGHSDNDGCFTAGFSMAEMFRYAVLRRELGENDSKTIAARKIATRAVEACLLLTFVHGRGDGFVARTYLTKDEPVPDDGLFYARSGDKAVCLETNASRKRGIAGLEVPATAEIPKRLARLYEEDGYTADDIIYKGDTSSDEISLHFQQMYFAHEILGPDDSELDELIITAVKNTMNHIIDHGFELHECNGRPTSWAKWSPEYFEGGMGWADAPLNAAEVLMYLRVTMHVTGEQGKWLEAFEQLMTLGYDTLTTKHFDRFWQAAAAAGIEVEEDIMYGDHMLATAAYWTLIMLEPDGERKEKYRAGYRSWRTSIAREHNPAYDFPFAIACPDDPIDMDKAVEWINRTNTSRLAAGVTVTGRHDVPVKMCRGGCFETGALLPPDERFISKYDRNPYWYTNEDSGGTSFVESCYVYTFAYWLGRYYGFFN